MLLALRWRPIIPATQSLTLEDHKVTVRSRPTGWFSETSGVRIQLCGREFGDHVCGCVVHHFNRENRGRRKKGEREREKEGAGWGSLPAKGQSLDCLRAEDSEPSTPDPLQVRSRININLNNKENLPGFKPAWVIGCQEKPRQQPLLRTRSPRAWWSTSQRLCAPASPASLARIALLSPHGSSPEPQWLTESAAAVHPPAHFPPLKFSHLLGPFPPLRSRVLACPLQCPQFLAHGRQRNKAS